MGLFAVVAAIILSFLGGSVVIKMFLTINAGKKRIVKRLMRSMLRLCLLLLRGLAVSGIKLSAELLFRCVILRAV